MITEKVGKGLSKKIHLIEVSRLETLIWQINIII